MCVDTSAVKVESYPMKCDYSGSNAAPPGVPTGKPCDGGTL